MINLKIIYTSVFCLLIPAWAYSYEDTHLDRLEVVAENFQCSSQEVIEFQAVMNSIYMQSKNDMSFNCNTLAFLESFSGNCRGSSALNKISSGMIKHCSSEVLDSCSIAKEKMRKSVWGDNISSYTGPLSAFGYGEMGSISHSFSTGPDNWKHYNEESIDTFNNTADCLIEHIE